MDGHHRIRAWTELKAEGVRLPDYPRIVRAGLSEDDKVAHVLALNLARRHLTPKQRAEVVGMLRVKGWSLRRIAEVAGISEGTVRRDLGAIASDYAIDLPDRIERRNGGTYPARRPSVTVTSSRDERRALTALGTDAWCQCGQSPARGFPTALGVGRPTLRAMAAEGVATVSPVRPDPARPWRLRRVALGTRAPSFDGQVRTEL